MTPSVYMTSIHKGAFHVMMQHVFHIYLVHSFYASSIQKGAFVAHLQYGVDYVATLLLSALESLRRQGLCSHLSSPHLRRQVSCSRIGVPKMAGLIQQFFFCFGVLKTADVICLTQNFLEERMVSMKKEQSLCRVAPWVGV